MALSLLFSSLLFHLVSLAPTPATQSTCSRISSQLPGKLALPKSPEYNRENGNYYNIGLADLGPACIVHPTNAQEVAEVVKILRESPDVPYAVKSGGHDPNPGHSSVRDGILIALSKIAGVQYDTGKHLATFGPGGAWEGVIGPLEKQGVTVVGGRLDVVGVGGYVMQGGLSFLSAQHGLACDNIVEYETVFANGTVANVSYDSNPDLVVAMRGGGNQFGIVTKFTAKTYPMGQVWGGIRVYSPESASDLFNALHEFIKNPTDPKAAVIFTLARVVGTTGFSLIYCYDGPKPPKTAYGKMLDIEPMVDLTATMSYGDLLKATTNPIIGDSKGAAKLAAFSSNPLGSAFGAIFPSGPFNDIIAGGLGAATRLFSSVLGRMGPMLGWNSGSIPGSIIGMLGLWSVDPTKQPTSAFATALGGIPTRASFRSTTIPLSTPEFFLQLAQTFANITDTYTARGYYMNPTIALQPFPALIGAESEKRGGNSIGLSAGDHPRFIVEIAGVWVDSTQDQMTLHISKEIGDALERLKDKVQASEMETGTYNPYFMNDAHGDQDVTSSYKDKAKFAAIQKEVDPDGFWTRTGGFKY